MTREMVEVYSKGGPENFNTMECNIIC